MSVAAKRVLVSPVSWEKLKELWVTQVIREVAARKHKAAKAAEAATAKAKALKAQHGEANGELCRSGSVLDVSVMILHLVAQHEQRHILRQVCTQSYTRLNPMMQ